MAHLKRLEAARHRRQRKILGTVWKNRFTTEAVCKKMGSNTMQSTFKEQRLRWFGHIHCMRYPEYTGRPCTGLWKIRGQRADLVKVGSQMRI